MRQQLIHRIYSIKCKSAWLPIEISLKKDELKIQKELFYCTGITLVKQL